MAAGNSNTTRAAQVAGIFAVVVLLAAAITAALVVFVVRTPPPGEVADLGAWSEADPCPTVLFVGVRGTDQDPGIGPQLEDAYGQFVSLLRPPPDRDITVASYPLDYPAARGGFGDSSAYVDSVEEGAETLVADVEALTNRCASARFVLGGYSQGAHVISIADHDRLATGTVDAVVLLANPVFSPHDESAKLENGFDPNRGGLFGQVDFDGELAGRTIQVCLDRDPFCQAGTLGVFVHTNGYYGEALGEAAAWAAHMVEDALLKE